MKNSDEKKTVAASACKGRLLIVDDDPLMREIIGARLQSAGYQVRHAENGAVACDLVRSESFDLLVVDLSMPEMDGFELLRHIRQFPRTVDLPVVVLTSSNDPESIEKAYGLGASSFVTKPVNGALFVHHVQFVLRTAQTEAELRTAKAEALSAVRMKNGLFNVLSHELKTPLIALIGLTDVMASALGDRVKAAEAEQLSHIVDASRRLNSIITDIIMLAKASSGKEQLSLAPSDISETLDDSLVGLKKKAKEKDISIKIRPLAAPILATFDPVLIRQALHNLADNAIKFSPVGSFVEIRANAKGDGSLVISVRDNGTGIAPQKLEDCLQPFVQDDMSYGRPADGLGFGLPIAKAIAEAHGGELLMQNNPGGGLLAALCLPECVVLDVKQSSAA